MQTGSFKRKVRDDPRINMNVRISGFMCIQKFHIVKGECYVNSITRKSLQEKNCPFAHLLASGQFFVEGRQVMIKKQNFLRIRQSNRIETPYIRGIHLAK